MQTGPMPPRNAICLCVDRNMLVPALFVADAVKSTAASPANRFDLILFVEPSEITEVHKRWMKERGIILCDNLDMTRLRGVAKFQQRLSVATLVKLVLAEHLAARYDKILYLDADLTIHDDVTTLFSLDTGDFALAAVPCGWWANWLSLREAGFIEHARALGMTEPDGYVNTGVLLIDVAKWNRAEIGSRILDFIRRNAELCFLPDEHGLNAVLNGREAVLSPVWNMAASVWRHAGIHDAVEPIIIHYTGGAKPWKKYGYGKRLLQNRRAFRWYRTFLRDSPWPGWLDAQWTDKDFRRNLAYELKLIGRRLRRSRSSPPTRRQRQIAAEEFRSYCSGTRFADVDQGLVTREGGRLRLNKQSIPDGRLGR
jgi:lipopolysaccharide biosynthesis glycosyltransferase